MRSQNLVQKLINIGIFACLVMLVVFFVQESNLKKMQSSLKKDNTQLQAQVYSERMAYSKLLEKMEAEKAQSSKIKYLPPPTLISVTSKSNQYIVGSKVIPSFLAGEELIIEGLSVPLSVISLFFEPGDMSFSAIAREDGSFQKKIDPYTFKNGTYKMFTEAKIDDVSSGKVRKLDFSIRTPVDRKYVLVLGSIVLSLIILIFLKVALKREEVKAGI